MCGIAGFTHLNGVRRREIAYRITEALCHRGPDQRGVHEGSQATLCAVRLKIIDLNGGGQPLASDDGDTAIVFNGEVYNHLEVRAELEGLGHEFHSECDTETVLHAFLEWDTGCLPRLRGMFALALWTESSQRLILARDPMGIKPLYYTGRGDDVYFGSELKAILEHPDKNWTSGPSPDHHKWTAVRQQLRQGSDLSFGGRSYHNSAHPGQAIFVDQAVHEARIKTDSIRYHPR